MPDGLVSGCATSDENTFEEHIKNNIKNNLFISSFYLVFGLKNVVIILSNITIIDTVKITEKHKHEILNRADILISFSVFTHFFT
jgi:hypothetical protein